MNFVFWLLIVLLAVLIWFLLAFTFKPIGNFFYRLWRKAFDEIENKDEEREDFKK